MTSFPFPPAFLALGSRSPRGRAMDRMRLITTILENLECDRGRLKEKEEELILSEEGAIIHFLCLCVRRVSSLLFLSCLVVYARVLF